MRSQMISSSHLLAIKPVVTGSQAEPPTRTTCQATSHEFPSALHVGLTG